MQIAPWSGGQIFIKYRRVDCTPPGSIRIELMNVNGDYGWLRLTAQVRQCRPRQAILLMLSVSLPLMIKPCGVLQMLTQERL